MRKMILLIMLLALMALSVFAQDTLTTRDSQAGGTIIAVSATSAGTTSTGIEHEDIGIAVATTDAAGSTIGSDPTADDFDSDVSIPISAGDVLTTRIKVDEAGTELDIAVDTSTAAASGFMKIGDIKGESTESSDNTDPSTIAARENQERAMDFFLKIKSVEGESEDTSSADLDVDSRSEPSEAKKPKEIVVVGSKVKEVIREAQYRETDFDFVMRSAPRSQDDIENLAIAIAATDKAVEHVSINFEKIEMHYTQPAKLLGLFDVDYTAQASVDSSGRVKVKFPWWIGFSKSHANDIKTDLENELASVGEDAQLANIDLQNSLQRQQDVLQTLSNIMKSQHDTAMAVIRKIG